MNKEMGNTAFGYVAKDKDGQKIKGIVIALSLQAATELLAKRGLSESKVSFEPIKTIQWRLMTAYPKKELTQLYNLLGQNMKVGMPADEAIKVSQLFISDLFIKNACEQMIINLGRGVDLATAMRRTGFDETDCKIMEALKATAGGYANAMTTRAQTLEYESEGEQEVVAELRYFLGFSAFIYIMLYLIMFYVADVVAGSIESIVTENKRVGFLKFYVNTFSFLREYQLPLTVLYLSAGVGFTWLLVSDVRYKIIRALIPTYDKFNEMLDQYRTWQLYLLLSSTGIKGMTNGTIFPIAAAAVKHKSVQKQNKDIADGVRFARTMVEIIPSAVAMPRLRDQLLAAFKGQSESATLQNFMKLLEFDILQYKKKTVFRLNLVTKIIVATFFTGILLLLLLPNLMLAGAEF